MSSIFPVLLQVLIAATSLTLIACGAGGTRDIEAFDQRTFVGSIEFEKKLSDRGTSQLGYTATLGKNTQELFSSGVQINGNRLLAPGTIKNTYNFHALSWNYRYNVFNGEILKLFIAPGAFLGFANVDVNSESFKGSLSKAYPGYGAKVGASLALSSNLFLLNEYVLYDLRAQDVYFSSGVWLAYNVNQSTGIKIGASILTINDDRSGNSDGCYSATEENCRDSELALESAGLQMGVTFKR